RPSPPLVSPMADDESYTRLLSSSPDWPIAKGSSANRAARALGSWKLRYGVLGLAAFLAIWYVVSTALSLPRFKFVPDPWFLLNEWISREPKYGVSLFTPIYYEYVLISTVRVYTAFALAVLFGAPLGILLGWSRLARNMIFPIVKMLRPIPPLAWLPLALLMLYGTEMPVIFVTLLAAFFVTVLNTYFGVISIDDSYLRAAACLGYNRWQTLLRVVVPGALPCIFTGLQIAMGVAWFSLVGGELIAGRSGLGYMIFDAYTQVALPNIFIGMITLGVLGYISSAIIRRVGARLMVWQAKGGR
ncbi:MAG: ABC transporter permease, partial [Vicinamibacterales bacterium]